MTVQAAPLTTGLAVLLIRARAAHAMRVQEARNIQVRGGLHTMAQADLGTLVQVVPLILAQVVQPMMVRAAHAMQVQEAPAIQDQVGRV